MMVAMNERLKDDEKYFKENFTGLVKTTIILKCIFLFQIFMSSDLGKNKIEI